MGKIIEKRLRLRKHGSNDVIYPKTLASLVMTKDGKTVEEAIEDVGGNPPAGITATLPADFPHDEFVQDAAKAAELRDALFLQFGSKTFMRTTDPQLAAAANERYEVFFDEPYHYMALFTYGVQYLLPGDDIDAYCMVSVYFNLAGDEFAIIYTEM